MQNHLFILHIFRSHLVKSNSPDLALRLAHLDEQRRSAGALARKFRAGLYARASGEQRQPTTTVNISSMKKLITAYHNNGARGSAIKSFAKGRYRDDMLNIKTNFDGLVLMATQVFMEAAGCRFNLIRKLKVSEVLAAEKIPEPCVACGEMTTHFRKHIRRCKKLKRAKQRGDHLRKVNYSRAINFFGHKVCMNVYISELSRSLPHLLACRF